MSIGSYCPSAEYSQAARGPGSFQEAAFLLCQKENYTTEEDRKAARCAAQMIRNEGSLRSIEEGKVVILPCNKVAHIWNLALESPFFDRMWRANFRECGQLAEGKESIELHGNDPESLEWVIEYLESGDEKRRTMLLGIDHANIFNLLFEADYLQLYPLREALELLIIERKLFEESSFNTLAAYDFSPYKYLKTFIFLVRLNASRDPGASFSTVLLAARKTILSHLKHEISLDIDPSMLDFLMSYNDNEAPSIELWPCEGWNFTDAPLHTLDLLAIKFNSRRLRMQMLSEKLKLFGATLERTSERKIYVNGFSQDNFFPGSARVPEPQSERYHQQKRFHLLPCPSSSFDAVITLNTFDPGVFDLIGEYSDLKLGIKASKEVIETFDAEVPPLPNVHLFACPDDLRNQDALAEKLSTLMRKLPKLEIAAVPPSTLEIFERSQFSSLTAFFGRKIELWNSLSGKVVKTRVAIHNAFDFELEKQPDSYVERLRRKEVSRLYTQEDWEIRNLLRKIPFARSDLSSQLRRREVRQKSSFAKALLHLTRS